jgi:hypothetical protein
VINEPPITPPPELVEQWRRTAPHPSNEHEHYYYITLCAAQWGADQELEACCETLESWGSCIVPDLCSARRPKPPSLKTQALEAFEIIKLEGDRARVELRYSDWAIIRRALEALPDD